MVKLPQLSEALKSTWNICEDCGEAHGLPISTPTGLGSVLCIPCYTQHLLWHAAHGQLEALVSPIVGAWASHWMKSGVPFRELLGIVTDLAGTDLDFDSTRGYHARALRRLSRMHPAPTEVPDRAPALRTVLTPDDFPTLVEYRPAAPDQGISQPYFVDDGGEAVVLFPTMDTLVILQPDGTRLLIVTGYAGKTTVSANGPTSLYVPPRLWEQVDAVLNPV